MKVVLKLGEVLDVELDNSDGGFRVEFGEHEVSIHSNLPDSDGREGKIYSERYTEDHNKMIDELRKEGELDDDDDEKDPTIIWQKGPYRVRQSSETEKYHVFDVDGIAKGENLEHDHMVEFHDLKGAKQYIALQLRKDAEKGKGK